MKGYVEGVIHFMDGTRVVLKWPRQAGDDPVTVAANIKKALEAERIMAEVGGSLLVIPVRNIKYIQITPSPEKLPKEVLRGAWVEE
jgi:type 1 glutamine amidotransferase